ncbi:scavenger receptor [Mactra antiquata]
MWTNIRDLRLFRGDELTVGIVQVYSDNIWYTICGHGFDQQAALVVCSQLGYTVGEILPMGAFREYLEMNPYPEQYQGCPMELEDRLLDCSFSGSYKCTPHRLAYASVKCSSNSSPIPENTIQLVTQQPFPDSGYLSVIQVYRTGTWGYVCGEFWDDIDADIACKQLGFSGGVSAYGSSDWKLPILVNNINCTGDESAWSACSIEDVFCYNDKVGAVFCNSIPNAGPTFSLVGGHKPNSGKVVISIDGQNGLVCNSGYYDNSVTTWSNKETNVICYSLGYHGGVLLQEQIEAGTINEVFLDGVQCDTGIEDSLLHCSNNGWKNVTNDCQSTDAAVSVYCFGNVRLVDSDLPKTKDLLIGRVEVYDDDDEDWHAVCADVITQDIADVICSEFEFTEAEILFPGNFGYGRKSYESINKILCTGDEESLSQCTYTIGQCSTYTYHAALACKHSTTDSDIKVVPLKDNYYGRVYMERYGLVGQVCLNGWTGEDASVLCRQMGYGHHSGITLANRPDYSMNAIWATQFSCDGTENSLLECNYEMNLSFDWLCADNNYIAGALCYMNKPPSPLVRLADSKSKGHGRAEVYNDVSGWGTVCNSNWDNKDAAVFCREAGYADGQTHASAFSQAASDDTLIVLSSVKCGGTETSIFHCGNKGWLSSSPCYDHTTDAGVFCYSYVNIHPGLHYGAVQYHTGDEYGLVCADGFDENAATVVCREMGFTFGMTLCCSAFGPLGLDFSMTDVYCYGDELSLTDCSFNEGSDCTSETYASVLCTHYYNTGYIKVKADPIVKITYNMNEGLVCSDKFTDNDATFVCKQVDVSLVYGKAFKASAKYNQFDIRWLNGLGCQGNETSIVNCADQTWGQIGYCSWDSVAAVICSDNEADMDFDIRIVNGTKTSGRVEIMVKGQWGTLYGTDMTRSEARVICRELGFHGGMILQPGVYGRGIGDIILTGISCGGNESSVMDCIWSGYSDNTARDPTKDAAVNCFYNTRLVGSTLINYGRLEMYDGVKDIWYAVCDGSVNVNNAQVICQQMGYSRGMFQRGSALGPTHTPISIIDIDCSSECTFVTGSCYSGSYLTLYCSSQALVTEDVKIELPLSTFYGPVSIQRFELWGHVCSEGFDDDDATVVCSQLGYHSGVAVKTFGTDGHPVIQGNVDCVGDENMLALCSRGLFAEDTGCSEINTVAGVMCTDGSGISYNSGELDYETGVLSTRAQVIINGRTLSLSADRFSDADAAVYCNSLGYSGGEAYSDGFGSYGISNLECTGNEKSILECPATWDPEKTKDLSSNLAGVRCFTAVRLVMGDPTFYGAVMTSKGVDSGLVCADNFDEVDADTVCRSLDFDNGVTLCCAPFGTIDEPSLLTNLSCPDGSDLFTQCSYDMVTDTSCERDYAAVACYNGPKPTDYVISLEHSDSYSGNIIVTYMGINGSICMDEWDDNDAHVACKELGYNTGLAYTAARPVETPFWMSEIKCTRRESKLSQCPMTQFGDVKSCTNHLSHAGVLCYDFEGLYATLTGTNESRYGRVELAVDNQWWSLCNTHWNNKDAHVICKMLDFRAGEAYHGEISEEKTGPVWNTNFMCSGDERSLTKCMSSGWRASTSANCANHENDAGAFCYTSVKLSTGVGRETDQGAVLLYKDDRWYTVCGDGFTRESARVVCKELGFRDGEVQTGSKYGPLDNYLRLDTHQMSCIGDEADAHDCLTEKYCDVTDYASVICYQFEIITKAPVTTKPEKSFDVLPIIIGAVVGVCVIVIFIIIFCLVLRHRRRQKERKPFDDSIINRHGDGSVHVSNPLQETPQPHRVKYNPTDPNVHMSVGNPQYLTVTDTATVNNNANEVQMRNSSNSLRDEDPHIYNSIRSEHKYMSFLPENAELRNTNT